MSTRVNGRFTPHLDSATDYQCRWQWCSSMVTHRWWRRSIYLCQDHALLTWSTVQAMMDEGRYLPTPEQPKRKSDKGRVGSIYYIRINDRVKIGYTTDLDRRLATYPPNMEVLKIIEGTPDLERREHLRFSEFRTDGREWFEANDYVLQMISEIPYLDDMWEPGDFQRRKHQPQVVVHRKARERVEASL